jgi:hypothetical protein
MSDIVYSNIGELNKAAKEQGLVIPENKALENPDNTINSVTSPVKFEDLPEDILGEQVAYMMQRYQIHGYVPTFKEAIAYRKHMEKKEASFIHSAGEAISQTTSDLYDASKGIVGDALTLRVPKVVGSVVEGAALGTKNWFYMYEQAKYDEHSFLSKMLYGNHASDEDYYENLKKTIELNKLIEKDRVEGILVDPKVKIGDTEIDLTNPAVVQGISYVADPSWAMPQLGIEAAIVKSMRGAAMATRLGTQLSKAGAYAAKKAATGFGKLADFSSGIANAVQTIDNNIVGVAKEVTSHDHYINGTGTLQAQDAIVRNAENSLGIRIAKIPLWGTTTAVFGVSKVVEGVSRIGEAIGKNAFDTSLATGGLTLSERVAQTTEGKIGSVANFYSKSVSPMTEWMGQTAKTSIHSGMYGGAFGLAFGGEEGMYHGFGTGLVLGSAFHQVGAFANAVQGADKYRTVLKNFLWASEHYDFYKQEGVYHLMDRVVQEGGEEARYSLMAQLGATERILRDEKMLVLTEERIKEMSSSDEWDAYQKQMLEDSEFGGVTFSKINGDNVILVNADRAVKSAVSEELFHGLMLEKRYKKAFVKHTVDNLIGTEDAKGALLKMPREQSVRILEQFRDQYFRLDAETQGHTPQAMERNLAQFNEAIERFKAGENPTNFRGFFEEFLASYWNRFIEDKPLDYLVKGGDLGIIRNAIEWGKDMYRDILRVDLSEAGVQLIKGANPDAFLIDQNTKQRIRVPMLEKLMKHYVKEINKEMYSGWAVNKEKYRDTFSLLNNQLEHLIPPEDIGKAEARVNPDSVKGTIASGLQNIAERLSQVDRSNRGTTLEIINDNGVTLASFSGQKDPSKKPKKTVAQAIPAEQKKDFWRKLPKSKQGAGVTREGLRAMGGVKKGKEPKRVEMPATEGTGAWETDKGLKARGEFWESVWQGNPRIRIRGMASNEELAIFREYLPENVVKRFAELNQIIERSKVGQLKDISNIVKATVITESKENEDGTRKFGHFMSARRFIPVELNLYFSRVKKSVSKKTGDITYEVGEANLKATVLDWDALLTREEYAFNKVDDGDLNYKTVQRLFGTRAELREAVKAMLANYSLGSRAQAGIKLFMNGKGGERDAALKRDIVNAVIGYHPTKGMEQTGRGWYNEPRDMQLRQSGKKRTLPTTMTDFRVDLIGTMRIEDGEGFRYDHDEAYKRSQANFSPAITHRDHEGNPMPSHARSILANTRYRNKEGEIIAVYPLRTPTSEITVKKGANKIYDVVAEDLVDAMEKKGIVRGSMYTSPSGWLHFTADGHEAGYTVRDKMRTGYINTSRHLDLSDLGNSGSIRSMVVEIGKRVNETTSLNAGDVVKQILELKDADGNKLYDIFKNDEDIISTHLDTIESWLFTPQSRKLFAKLGIDSVEYRAVNPNSGNEFSAVAIFAPERFIENRTRYGLEQFQFSPSRTIEESLRKQMARAGSTDLASVLKYRIDEFGDPVPNTKRITTKTVDDLIRLNKMLVEDAKKALQSGGFLNDESKAAYEKALIPYAMREFKKKFPNATDDVLRQVAEYSLKGFVTYVESLPEVRRTLNKPFGATTEVPTQEVKANSAFVETALKMGITPEALMETGIPSLGHWMEMSEAEFHTLKNYKNYAKDLAAIIKERKAEGLFIDKGAIQRELISRVLAKNNGITGLIDNIGQRQRELFFLMDETMGGVNLAEKFALSTHAKRKLNTEFVIRTRKFVGEQLKLGRNASLKKIKDAFDLLVESGRDIPSEVSEAMAVLTEHERKAESIITQDNMDRIMDIMAAYSIKELDMDTLEQVRAKIYDEASKGFYNLGSPESIARSVELYATYDGGKNKRYIDVKKTIKENFIKALDDLERKGMRGVWWSKLDTSRTGGVITLGSNEAGIPNKFSVTSAMRFDGTNFHLIRRTLTDALKDSGLSEADAMSQGNAASVVELVDGDGRTLDRIVLEYGEGAEKLKEKNDLFLRRATSMVNKLVPELSVANGKFQTVEGAVKEFLLRRAVKASGRTEKDMFSEPWTSASGVGTDTQVDNRQQLRRQTGGQGLIKSDAEIESLTKSTSKWELYRNGDYFLAWPISDERKLPSGRSIAEEITFLKGQLKNGVVTVPKKGRQPETTRQMTVDEKVQMRTDIAKLQKDVYLDLGFTFKVDNKYGIEILDTTFNSIEHREQTLAQMRLGTTSSKGFESFLKKTYLSFDKKLKELKETNLKKIDIVLSEKDKRGAIPQIKALLQELHGFEATKKKFITNEMLAYNKANKQRGTGKKQSVDGKAMHRLLKDRLDNYSRAQKQAETQYLAIAEQMRKYNLLERSEGFTPEMVESMESRIAFSDPAELSQYMMPPPPKGVALADWATNLRMEFRKRLAEFEYRDRLHQQLNDNLYGLDDASADVVDKIQFLISRYMEARGYRNIDASSYFRRGTEEGSVGYTDLKWKELKAGVPERVSGFGKDKSKTEPVEKQERRYLPDKEGILDTPLPDDHKTPEELIKEFKDGLEEAADQWYIGKNRDQMHLDDVLKWGRHSANGENSTSGALIRGLSKDKFDATELAWINNPENKSQVAEFHGRWASEEATPTQIISEIKDAVLSSTVGKDGIQLRDTVKALNETIRKIGVVSDRLRIRHGVEASLTPKEMENPYAVRTRSMVNEEVDPIQTYRKDMPNDIGKLQEEITNLRAQKISLEARYKAILKKASGRYASPEFRKMVQQMRGEDVRERIARKNTSQRRAEEKSLQKQLASSEKELFRMYDDIARNMRMQNPELIFESSRIEVHPNDPRTQYLFYSFGALSWDFFGTKWQIDLSLTTAGKESPLGISAQRADISPTDTPVIKQINKQERATRRKIYLADYIHYAVNKRRFHERNPSEPMSPMDANLFSVFFKRDVQGGLFRDKIARIPVEQMQMQEAMNQGIIESFRNPDERSRFIRSFVVDALDLISTDKALREKAFMNLKGINYEQYKKLVAENPKYVTTALDTLEVVEKAMYLIKDGNIPAGEAGEVFNKRDFFSRKFSIEENNYIKSVEDKHKIPAGTIKRILSGELQGVPLPKEIQRMVSKNQQPFLTRANIGFVPVDTLVRMHGFDEIWRQHLSDEGYNTALFALDGMWNVKKAYEQMPPQERMALQASRVNRLLLENRANQMQAAKEMKERYRKRDKAVLAPESMPNWAYGQEDSIVKDEFKRVDEILKTAMSVEATIQRYKGDAVTFVNKRPFALDQLLALDDKLQIDGAKRNKDRTLSIDWDNPDKPQWRDTVDGRYFIKREVNSKGKESFKVYFKGQTFKTAEGVLAGQIGVTSFATVENLTQAQVAIRFFEDDVNRVVLSSRLIKGGVKKFEPMAVGEQVLPVQNVDKIFAVWDEVPAFSQSILDLYMENKGTPFFREQMAEKLAGIGQYGETVYIKEWEKGRWKKTEITITPRESGRFAEHYTKTTSPDGHTMYIRKKDTVTPEPTNLGSDSATNKEQATSTPATEKQDKVEKTVSDASKWNIIEMDKSSAGDHEEWSIIRNKLGYTMLRLKNPATGRSVFRLFNPASAFMAETHHEIDAMEHILDKELEGK